MLCPWNATSGSACHAGLIGRELAKTNELTVFAPTLESISIDKQHLLIEGDKDFVIQEGWEQTWGEPGLVDERLRSKDYDLLIVQPLDRMPIPTLKTIFPEIKAKKIQVIHEWRLPNNPEYYQLDFNAIVCFDHRYRPMLLEKYPEEKIHVIPYPCHPCLTGNKEEAREKLGLPQDALILFSFGRQPLEEYKDYLQLTSRLTNELAGYKLIYLIVRGDNEKDWPSVKKILNGPSCIVRFERPPIDRLYDYLHASDIHLVPKGISTNLVVSSTVFQCLGSGTPIIIRDTRYVEELDREVLKYQPFDIASLKMHVLRLIEDDDFRKRTIEAVEEYIKKNSAQKVAESFMELYNSLGSQ